MGRLKRIRNRERKWKGGEAGKVRTHRHIETHSEGVKNECTNSSVSAVF